MSETQVLLSRIAALRQQLEQVRGLTTQPETRAVSLLQGATTGEDPLPRLEQLVADGSTQTVLLDRTLRQLTPVSSAADTAAWPRRLTARARRILEEGRELLRELRSLADTFEPAECSAAEGTGICHEQPAQAGNEPLRQRYRETAAMANTALRILQAFPDAASAQLSLCEGLEIILEVVAERVAELKAVLAQRRQETEQVATLARLLRALYAKEAVRLEAFVALAEALLAEAQQAAPLRFLSASPDQPALFIASHSLTVAQVTARLVRHDPDFRSDLRGPVLAALLHDAGMLGVPPTILAQAGPLEDGQRRTVEAHTRLGAELLACLQPTESWLAAAALGHHERLDGTGYPAGRQEAQIEPLTRLIAVCDVYAALCARRPQRPARDTRTALTDTLLLAEQGALDRYHAERLLRLSFYPVGTVVELADGAVGVVVATHMGRRDLSSPARPVLALLTDAQGRFLPVPHHVDLAECEEQSIVRTLPTGERGSRLGSRYPSLG